MQVYYHGHWGHVNLQMKIFLSEMIPMKKSMTRTIMVGGMEIGATKNVMGIVGGKK